MSPAKALMIETLRAIHPQPFVAAMVSRADGSLWGVWHHVYEVRWLFQPPDSYKRLVISTSYWPSELVDAHKWAAANVAPPPFLNPCPYQDSYCEEAVMHDLRFFSACPRVLDAAPWLPERLAAVQLLEELS